MRRELRCLAMSLLCLTLAGPASAGPNEGGVIILHAIPYQSRDWPPLCPMETGIVDCEDAVVNVETYSTWEWFVLGFFPVGSSPSVRGVSFGVDYDDYTVIPIALESCGDFELPDSEWPRPGTGTAVTWSEVQTHSMLKIYAFAGYEYYGEDTAFCLTPHPSQGGNWADDSIPAILDPIADYGCLGFNSNPGYLPCPGQPEVAACCLSDGSCQMSSEEECAADGGTWIGPGTTCDPNPCSVPVSPEGWGAVKRLFR